MLGLTLCYEDEDAEGNTEIFIDDIAPSGLAARDGRLRLGDQIIQVREREGGGGWEMLCCVSDSDTLRDNWTEGQRGQPVLIPVILVTVFSFLSDQR